MDDEIWTTKDGRKIPVGEMDENHVRNALRMVLRRRRQLHERIESEVRKGSVRANLALKLLGIKLPSPPDETPEWERDYWASVAEDRKWGERLMSQTRIPPLNPDIVYYMVSYGSLSDGITFFGPFTHDNAVRYAEHISGTGFDSQVIPLTEARIMTQMHGFFPMGPNGYEVT
jgi:hypothetical protein